MARRYLSQIVIVFFFLIVFTKCDLRKHSYSESELLELKRLVVFDKNKEALLDLDNYFSKRDSVGYCEILPYLIATMDSTNYDWVIECYMTSKFRNEFDLSYLDSLEIEEKNFLVSLLNKGIKNGNFNCKTFLIEMYDRGIYFKQDKFKADSLYEATYHQKKTSP